MLVVEYHTNGKRVVKLHKDWHPGMMSKAYLPRQRNYVNTDSMLKVQAALLRKDKK